MFNQDKGPPRRRFQSMGSTSTSPVTQAGDTPRRRRAGARRAAVQGCSHSVMSRVYHPGYKCAVCKNPPQFGWIYRCTQDRDVLIMSAQLKGDKVRFGSIDEIFANEMNLGKFGPDKRTQKYSFLKEITTEQLHSYTPSQLHMILSQRDHVAEIVAESRQKASQKYPDDNMPWVPDDKAECQHKVCQSCHKVSQEKSWVSLNGVLNGDILPTVATDFAFSFVGSRPIVDVQVAKNLGCRPVSFPYFHVVNLARRAREGWGDLEDHIDSWFQANPDRNADHRSEAMPDQEEYFDDSTSVSVSNSDSGECYDTDEGNAADWTPLSPDYVKEAHSDKLGAGTAGPRQISVQDHYRATLTDYSPLRPPWTPPPTPSYILEEPFDEAMDHVYNGRSPWSLKTNSLVRVRLFSSFPTISTVLGQRSDGEYRTEEMCDVGLVLPLDDALLNRACSTPLPRPDLDEEFLFAKGKISIGDFKHMQAFATAAPTDAAPAPAVIHSPDDEATVALMTEESVETGVPDVVLRVEGDNGAMATAQRHAN